MSDPNQVLDDEMLPEYSLEGGVRGKYADRFPPDARLVLLDADVAKAFPDAEAVNSALRGLVEQQTTPAA
ncbi:MAG TPA: hypothetical protein VF625_09540 [Longimicrobium sp.]|jgi:hypothetical protein